MTSVFFLLALLALARGTSLPGTFVLPAGGTVSTIPSELVGGTLILDIGYTTGDPIDIYVRPSMSTTECLGTQGVTGMVITGQTAYSGTLKGRENPTGWYCVTFLSHNAVLSQTVSVSMFDFQSEPDVVRSLAALYVAGLVLGCLICPCYLAVRWAWRKWRTPRVVGHVMLTELAEPREGLVAAV